MSSRSKPSASAIDKQRASSRRAAEAQARLAAARRRRRLLIVGSAVGAVVVVVGVLVGVRLAVGGSTPKSGQRAAPAATSVTGRVTGVPASVFDAVGTGSSAVAFKQPSGGPLTAAGKPEVLYIGAEWCPYCAATRWSLAVALSRFGTLTGLGQTASSPSDVYPNTPTLTFHGASFTSKYLTFVGKEIESNQVSGKSYAKLDPLDDAQAKLFEAAGGSFPFIDIGGRYLVQQAAFNPQVLAGKTQAQVAAQLADPTSAIARAVDGGANVITAAICRATGNQPGSVCHSPGVTSAAARL